MRVIVGQSRARDGGEVEQGEASAEYLEAGLAAECLPVCGTHEGLGVELALTRAVS